MIQSLIRITLFARLLIPRPKSYLFCRRLNSGSYLIPRPDRTSSLLLPSPSPSFVRPVTYCLRPSNYFQSGSSLKESSIARLITVAFLFPRFQFVCSSPASTFVIPPRLLPPPTPNVLPLFAVRYFLLSVRSSSIYFVQTNGRSKSFLSFLSCRLANGEREEPSLVRISDTEKKSFGVLATIITPIRIK